MTSTTTIPTARVDVDTTDLSTVFDDAPRHEAASAGERLARRAHELAFHVPMLAVLAAVLHGYLHPQAEDEEGASTAEWVIGTAIVAGLAIAVGAIIVAKVTAKANSIDLG